MNKRDYPSILIFDRETAEQFIGGGDDVCISIRSPMAKPAKLRGEYRDVLWLAFDDVAGFTPPYPVGAVPPSQEQAAAIASFAVKHCRAKRMVIHCEAGVSRSVTVALAISSKLSRAWAFPRWYRTEWRRTRHVRWRELFDAIQSAIDVAKQEATP